MTDFAERLQELMLERDIKSDQLAQPLCVSGATVRRWLNGGQQIFLSNLLRVADYFGCSLEFLAGRTETLLDYTPKPCPPFYDRFRAVLKEKGVTRYRFAKETRFKDPYFTKWKKGADPHIHTLTELADALNCTVDYLVGREQ